MKEIPLTQEKFALVDDEDFERLSKYKWYYDKFNGGAARSVHIPGSLNRTKGIKMAHEVLQTKELHDHIDRNKLNNQKSNLRPCSCAQNQYNRGKIKSKATSKYKGVHFDCARKKWMARIHFINILGPSRSKYLGRFAIEEDAARAYDEAAKQHFGEFAVFNFPKEGERSCINGTI